MSRLHASFVFGTLVLGACGGGSSNPDARPIDVRAVDAPSQGIDAAVDGPIVHGDAAPATGTKYRYVVNHEALPQTSAEAHASALDLNGDGVVDNQFGMVIATFSSQGIPTQTVMDTAISHGTAIVLGVLQTTDLSTATSSGFMTYAGANPSPAPCNGSSDTVCGHHLTGTGTFDIASGATIDPPLVGNFTGGTLTTPIGDSSMPLPLAFGPSQFSVNLVGARVKVTGATAAGLTAILAGAIPNSEMDAKVYPAIAAGFMASITADCSALTNPPTCGCTSGSNGAQTVALFDTNHDCAISVSEIKANSLIVSLFAPDVTIGGMPALSVGVTVTAVGATFTAP